MKIRNPWWALLLLAFAGIACAQTWSAEQLEVWQVELKQWQMAKDKDHSWLQTMTHPNVSVWDSSRQFPQNRDSIDRWNRLQSSQTTVLEQELFPLAIVVTGDVAVLQYRYVMVSENAKKEREQTTGRYTDILIKDGGVWKFIAWAGGDDPKK
jgi:ketosteroid isomerase-like protein